MSRRGGAPLGQPGCPRSGDDWEATTDVNGTLPAGGRYDVTCWVDRGGPEEQPNGVLDGPDRIGFAANVQPDGDGILGNQVVVRVAPVQEGAP